MSHRTMSSKETANPVSDASTTFFSRPYVIKSIPSWTITWVVQDVVSAKYRARESTSLVSVSIIMYMVLSKDLFRTLLEEVQKDSWKQSLIFVGLPLHVKYALCHAKNSPPVQCLCIIELVPKSTVEVFPLEAYEENPSLHP